MCNEKTHVVIGIQLLCGDRRKSGSDRVDVSILAGRPELLAVLRVARKHPFPFSFLFFVSVCVLVFWFGPPLFVSNMHWVNESSVNETHLLLDACSVPTRTSTNNKEKEKEKESPTFFFFFSRLCLSANSIILTLPLRHHPEQTQRQPQREKEREQERQTRDADCARDKEERKGF